MVTRVRPRRRADGLPEVVRVGRCRRWAVVLAMALLGIPATLMTLLALVAVLPVVALAIPPAVLGGGAFALWSAYERRREGEAAPVAARVVPLRREA